MCASCLATLLARLCVGVSRRDLLASLGAAGTATALGAALAPARAADPSATPIAAAAIDRYADSLLPTSDAAPTEGAIAVTFLGTTSLLVDDGETQLLIDGFITRPSLADVTTSEIATDPAAVDAALARAGAGRVAALFVAHSHWDHALDAAYVAQRTGARLHGSESTLNIARGGGLPEARMTLYAPGEPLPIGRFTVAILPSKHSPPTPGVNDDLGLTIDAPLPQPALVADYVEGGSFDILIAHDDHTILVKPSANSIAGALDDVRADVLFLGTATLGHQDSAFQHAFYDQTVTTVQPTLVIPVHWDDFFAPLTHHLAALDPQDLTAGFDFLIDRLAADGIAFGLMQGFDRIVLFGD